MRDFLISNKNNSYCSILLLLCLNHLLSVAPVIAQPKRPVREEKITLQAALNRLENHYAARLVYIEKDIPDMHVPAIKWSGDFGTDLQQQLLNSGLKATKISDKQYVLNKITSSDHTVLTSIKWTQGIVRSLNKNLPLEGATVRAENSGIIVHTDKNGAFKIPTGDHETVKIAYIGLKQQVLLPEAGMLLNVFLAPEQVHLNTVEIFSNTDFMDYMKKPDLSHDLQRVQLNETGRSSLPQSLNFSYSNINVGHYAIDNVASYLDPIRLNGQDADYIVVLIEGKKRHLFSGLNLNYTTGMGFSGVDLETIPQNFIQKIEVHPAQQSIIFGSESVGGAINFKFDTLFRGFNFRQQSGVTTRGDGLTNVSSLRYATGLPWSDKAFLDLSFTYKNQQSTNRSNAYGGLVYRSASDTSSLNKLIFSNAGEKISENKRLDDSLVSARQFNRNVARYGDGKSNNLSLWFHTSNPIGKTWKLYSFGGISSRNIRTYGFYRFPNDAKSSTPIYPDGYLPEDPASLKDAAITAGLSKNTGGYAIDVSTTYGRNAFSTSTENTVNPSMGLSSPTSFYLGKTTYSQLVNDITVNKTYRWREQVHLSTLHLGGQLINSRYQIEAGDESSYLDANAAGTPVEELKLSGTNGHLGFSPSNAVDQRRNQAALFGQATFSLNKYTEAGMGLRYENSTLFAAQTALSFDIKRVLGPYVILHATYNQSSKIPGLQQLYFSQTQYQFFPRDGISDVYKIMQVSSLSPLAADLGIPALQPERAREFHFSVNFSKDRFSLYALYNRIQMNNRLMVSGRRLSQEEELPFLRENYGVDAIQYFRNIPGSTTHVLQLIGGYILPLSGYSEKLVFQGDLAWNKTSLYTGPATTATAVAADRTFTGIVEDGQPKLKAIGKINYQSKTMSIFLRDTYFGPVWYRDSRPELDQYFKGKVITDLGASWQKNRSLLFTLAFNNLFNIYPDKVVENKALNTDRTFGNQIVYSRQTSQFGIYGTYVSLSIDYKW
ncbi:TonB-dependent receptor domain-containing protein [Pedobacter sp. AW31-3R]|uniref:TonB-dependent receptor domain-containing protein n=1 Tax=Pedobacter sp. AW31-3R TaxID=3445781 RepID=UPI003F9FFAB5